MRISQIVLTTAMVAALAACGGGGGGGGGAATTPSSSTVSGVAATGRAMQSGSVVVAMDSAGHTTSTTVGANGTFTLNIASLSYPILIKATENGMTLYSAIASSSESTGKININQLTHLAVVGLLGNDTPANIEAFFKAPGNADKVSAAALYDAELNAVAFMPDTVFNAIGLNRAQVRDVRIASDFTIGEREDKLLDQLTPSISAGKVAIANLTTIPTFAAPTRVTNYATAFNVPFNSNTWCNGTTDTTVYTTPDTIVYGVSATDQDKVDAARAAQISVNEIKAQLGYTAPGSGVGFDGTNKLLICVDGSGRASSDEGDALGLGVTAMSKDIAAGMPERKWHHLVKHELVHSFQGVLTGQTDPWNVLDRWFQEGMAEFLSGSDYLDTSAKVTQWQSAYERSGLCTPAKIATYNYMDTNCRYTDKEGEVLYRAYTSIIAMLFDDVRYGGGGNSLTKMTDLLNAIKAGTPFATAFDALHLTMPGVANPITMADLKSASWAPWLSTYGDKTAATITLTGLPNSVNGMALAFPNTPKKNDNISTGVSTDGTTAKVPLRNAVGSVVLRARSSTGTFYQSPTSATVTWTTDQNGNKTPSLSTSTFTYAGDWNVLQ